MLRARVPKINRPYDASVSRISVASSDFNMRGYGDGDRVLRAADLGPAQTAVAGRVKARQYLGGRQLLYVDLAGPSAPVVVSTFALPGADPWEGREDHPVWRTLVPDALTALDPD